MKKYILLCLLVSCGGDMAKIYVQYPNKNSGGVTPPPPLPSLSDIIFQHNLYDENDTAQVGSYTYSRTGTIYANDTITSVAPYSANALPYGMRWNGSETMVGAWIGGSIKNWILYSEDFTNAAWTAIGTGATSSNTATAPDGSLTADTISGSSSGDGITQSSGTAANSVSWVGSVWLKTSTGTATVKIVVKDAGNQQGFVECPLTTSWRRFQVPHVFNSGTGNVSFDIIVGNSSNVRAWGAQLERFNFTNTLGSRDRRAQANNYVKTTSAVADSGNASYTVPNSIFSQVSTEGSIAFWIMPDYDWFEIFGPSVAQTYFSANNETFALFSNPLSGLSLWINNVEVASCYDVTFQNTVAGLAPDRWNHVVVTWNTTTDVYKIYINGVDSTGTTTTSSAIATSTHTLKIGGYDPSSFPYLYADAYMSQVVIWDVALSAADALQAYQNKSQDAIRSAPGTGKLFEVALGTSIVPTTGDTEYYYAQRGYGAWGYSDSTTTIAQNASNIYPAPAYPLNGFNKGGMAFQANNQNLILQSEDIGTTWTSVTGAPTITANAGTFLGTISYGTILGVSGEGIKQAITSTAGDKWTGSVYASVASGTLNCRLVLIRDGTETINQDITLTTTPQRFNIYADFTSTPVTGVEMQFLLQATGTARVGGFQLESVDTLPRGSYQKVGTPYQKTTTTPTNVGWNTIVYRGSDSFNPNKGTLIAWAFLDSEPNNEFVTSNGPTLLAAPGQYGNVYWHISSNDYRLESAGVNGTGSATPFSVTQRIWYHYAVTYETSGGSTSVKMYLDGVEVDSTTTGSAKLLTFRKFMIGGDYVYGAMDYWQGAIDRVTIYGSVKDAAFILNDFNSTVGDYRPGS